MVKPVENDGFENAHRRDRQVNINDGLEKRASELDGIQAEPIEPHEHFRRILPCGRDEPMRWHLKR